MVEIGLERVEEGDELGMYHIVYIRQIDASHRFVHPPPKRIHVTVCQRQEAGLLRPADFTMVRDDIVAELRLRKQERSIASTSAGLFASSASCLPLPTALRGRRTEPCSSSPA